MSEAVLTRSIRKSIPLCVSGAPAGHPDRLLSSQAIDEALRYMCDCQRGCSKQYQQPEYCRQYKICWLGHRSVKGRCLT